MSSYLSSSWEEDDGLSYVKGDGGSIFMSEPTNDGTCDDNWLLVVRRERALPRDRMAHFILLLILPVK